MEILKFYSHKCCILTKSNLKNLKKYLRVSDKIIDPLNKRRILISSSLFNLVRTWIRNTQSRGFFIDEKIWKSDSLIQPKGAGEREKHPTRSFCSSSPPLFSRFILCRSGLEYTPTIFLSSSPAEITGYRDFYTPRPPPFFFLFFIYRHILFLFFLSNLNARRKVLWFREMYTMWTKIAGFIPRE